MEVYYLVFKLETTFKTSVTKLAMEIYYSVSKLEISLITSVSTFATKIYYVHLYLLKLYTQSNLAFYWTCTTIYNIYTKIRIAFITNIIMQIFI